MLVTLDILVGKKSRKKSTAYAIKKNHEKNGNPKVKKSNGKKKKKKTRPTSGRVPVASSYAQTR